MRLNKDIRYYLKSKIKEISPNGKIYLFGSRINDKLKGGDIDILILSENKINYKEIADVRISFWTKFGIQKIDIINYTFTENAPFKSLILNNAIEL